MPASMRDLHFERMRIPRRFWGVKDIALVQKYADNIKKNCLAGVGLYLQGGVGSRASELACGILARCVGTGLRGLFVFADDIHRMVIGRQIFAGNITFQERMLTVDLLVVDGLGISRDISELTTIVRKRFSNLQSTIITSNAKKNFWQPNSFVWCALEGMEEVLVPVRGSS